MRAVPGALGADGLITILKFIAAMNAGSSGLLAESLHSWADTMNQVFLLPGLRFYKRPASGKHPFGYGEERFFWSFIAAISSLASALSLLRGEAATPKAVERIRQAVLSHGHVCEVVELLTSTSRHSRF